jgi:hypothetical protein
MTETFDYDVFLSYSSKDRNAVHALAEKLRNAGLRVWLDSWIIQPGDPIGLKIQQGLEKSRVLLMFMSKAYFASDGPAWSITVFSSATQRTRSAGSFRS